MNILLTAIGGPSAICYAKSLHGIPGVRLIGVNAENETIGSRFIDRFYRVPLANDPSYLAAIRDIVRNEQIDHIIPFVDEELVVLGTNADTLDCTVLISSEKTIEHTNDKALSYDVLAEFLPRRFTSETAQFPLFAKPRVGRGGKGAVVVQNAAELAALPEEHYIFQEALAGPEITVDAFFDRSGKIVTTVPRIRAHVDQGISVEGEVFESQELNSMIEDIARILTFVGPINFQFMRGKDGYKLIEINARASGGTGITMNAGVDIPKLTLALLQDRPIESARARLGIFPNFDEVLERQDLKRRLEKNA
jgi:carbamoyl-phosphate synthase large subunit